MPSSSDTLQNETSTLASHAQRNDAILEELSQLKRQLLQAEVRLAKARAGVVGAEADVKVLTSRLRAITR